MLVMCVDRRVVWLLLILLSFSVFAYMTSTKLVYLLSYPKNVDLNVEFKPTLEFPSVTICNNNYFRYTFFLLRIILAFRFYYRTTRYEYALWKPLNGST